MKVEISNSYSAYTDFILSIPANFDRLGEPIYTGRNTLRRLNVDGQDFVIKSFKKPNLINSLVYSLVRKSKANRSYKNAKILLDTGLKTPNPVAFIENYKFGLLSNSFYVSENVSYDYELRDIIQNGFNNNETVIRELAIYTAELHKKHILHKDLSPGNILICKGSSGFSFYLLDLNRMKFKQPLSLAKRANNLKRLALTKNEYEIFADAYAKQMGDDITKFKKQLFNKVQKERNRLAKKGHERIEGW